MDLNDTRNLHPNPGICNSCSQFSILSCSMYVLLVCSLALAMYCVVLYLIRCRIRHVFLCSFGIYVLGSLSSPSGGNLVLWNAHRAIYVLCCGTIRSELKTLSKQFGSLNAPGSCVHPNCSVKTKQPNDINKTDTIMASGVHRFEFGFELAPGFWGLCRLRCRLPVKR